MPTMTTDSSQQQLTPPAKPALRQICPGGTTLTDAAVVRPPTTLDNVVAALLVGRGVAGEAASINLLSRAKEVVSKTDVPFLLQLPYTNHEVLYDIMTECYGLVPRVYTTTDELDCAGRTNAVDNDYVLFHDLEHNEVHCGRRPLFHFLATPHYQEGAGILTLKHKGRMIVMMQHRAHIAEEMFLLSRRASLSLRRLQFGGSGTMDDGA